MKTDRYALPSGVLKKAKRLIKQGKSRKEIAEAVLEGMARAAEENPKLAHRIGYLQESYGTALNILEVRLRICDPGCEEHANYSATLTKLRVARGRAKRKRLRRTDPEWREAENAKDRERKRKRKECPAYREHMRAEWRRNYARQAAKPEWRERRNAQQREAYAQPEVRAYNRAYHIERRKKIKAQRAADPALDKAIRDENARRARERRAKMREEEPERYEALKAKQRERGRERRKAQKKEKADANS